MVEKMTTEQLVEHFVAIALDQDKAMQFEENAKYNRLFGEMNAVIVELKQRAGDQRHALIPLLKHTNPQVRLKAAIATLALAPDAARNVLQAIDRWNEYPQAPYARGMLMALDDGSYTPS